MPLDKYHYCSKFLWVDRPSGGIVDKPVTNLNKAGIETKDVFSSEKIKSIVHKLNYLAIIHCSSNEE